MGKNKILVKVSLGSRVVALMAQRTMFWFRSDLIGVYDDVVFPQLDV